MSDTVEVRDPERLDLPSASAFEIIAECNGQPQLKKRLPPEAFKIADDSKDELTERGTRIHKARETGNTLPLSPEEIALYESGLRYEGRVLERWREVFSLQDVQEGERELRLWMHSPATLEPIASAQLDVHYLSGTHALIVDWKSAFCSRLVPAASNWQLKIQAVLLKQEHEELTDIRVAFAKPMFEKSPLDYCDYNEADLKYSNDSILYLLWWSTQPDAPRRAGAHCWYCPCKAWCPEALAYSLLPVAIARGVLSGKKPAEAINEVTLDDLGRVWGAGATIRKILDEVSDRLKGIPAEQLALIGIELGKGRELIQWTDPRGAFQLLTEKEKWDEAEVWKAFEPVLGRLAALQVKYSGVPEKEAPAMVKETLKAFYELKESAQILKRMK